MVCVRYSAALGVITFGACGNQQDLAAEEKTNVTKFAPAKSNWFGESAETERGARPHDARRAHHGATRGAGCGFPNGGLRCAAITAIDAWRLAA
jgi:hypothetical protein